MTNRLRQLAVILSMALLAAHFSRNEAPGLVMVALGAMILLLIKRPWAPRLLVTLLVSGSAEWVATTVRLAQGRLALGLPWGRLALILGVVALFTAGSAWLLRPFLQRQPVRKGDTPWLPVVVFWLIATLLAIVHQVVDPPLLLLERFLPGYGPLEIFLLGLYGAWLAEKLVTVGPDFARWRSRLWRLFGLVFFSQLLLGLTGVEECLMTGELHLPVPAVILAGPIFRGEGFFMVILFVAAILLAGPAWCSFLCYFGPADDLASRRRQRPTAVPVWRDRLQVAILILTPLLALLFRLAGVPSLVAVATALAFAAAGIGVMILRSRRHGTMLHCTAWCPMGWLATRLGKINPFRLDIAPACHRCGACTPACRYGALEATHLAAGRVGPACTLCGDCVVACRDGYLRYRFPGLTALTAHRVFIGLIVSVHALFLGVARI
ncbi:MAG: 4Fe-4S binding protein [Acidobacteria bacterium]|nr:4Fe-4S binding protein [Acidobacteriota bacterium]